MARKETFDFARVHGMRKTIRNAAKVGDYEAAHGLEDDLYREFVQWIIRRKPDAEDVELMAKRIYQTRRIKFCRVCS